MTTKKRWEMPRDPKAYVERTRRNLDEFERYLNGELPDKDCDWCGGKESLRYTPFSYGPVTFDNGVNWGQWRCLWYGQCEAAPG